MKRMNKVLGAPTLALMVLMFSAGLTGAAEVTVDFAILTPPSPPADPQGQSLGVTSYTDPVTGLVASGYYKPDGNWTPATLWGRNATGGGFTDRGIGVCDPTEGGDCMFDGDINELSNERRPELIVLQRPARFQWCQVWISSFDLNGGIHPPERGILWAAQTTPTTEAPGALTGTRILQYTADGSSVGSTSLRKSGETLANEFIIDIPAAFANSPFLIFEPLDWTGGGNTDNDHLVWKVVLCECPHCGQRLGEQPYIAVVGNDILANPFYLSPKYLQFLFDQNALGVPICSSVNNINIPVTAATRVGLAGCEQFRAQTPLIEPEVCDVSGIVNGLSDFTFFGEPNASIKANNSGFFEWFIRLPAKPNGEINLCIQCGILKPDSFAIYAFEAVEKCAAETGERVGPNCTRLEVQAGENPVINTALPRITAEAIPGPFAGVDFTTAFNLTAFRNPGNYTLTLAATRLTDSNSLQVLNGTDATRIMLKSCMDKCIVVKLPIEGQVNSLGQTEHDLEAGDVIHVRINIPRTSGTVSGGTDIYCHSQSLRVMGIAE